VQSASITQSDYTAECQNAKNAGVQLLVMALDGASVQRLVRSCMQIGYTDFIYSAIGIAVNVALAADQNVAKFAGYLGATTQPFTATDAPAVAAFRAAMARYAPGSPLDGSALYAWAGGKMIEAALAHVPEARTKPVTSQMVLEGLHSLKDETLGGLVAGLTFTAGKAATGGSCYYIVSLEGGKFGAPFGGRKRCL
jgi:branched-chain amino acid transport system substrate-binding protein